jgi:hypothetical protein
MFHVEHFAGRAAPAADHPAQPAAGAAVGGVIPGCLAAGSRVVEEDPRFRGSDRLIAGVTAGRRG